MMPGPKASPESRNLNSYWILMAAMSIGLSSGIILPGWWVAADTQSSLGLIAVAALLLLSLFGTVAAARAAGRISRGWWVFSLGLLSIPASIVLTWFSVGPATLVGIWTILAALLILDGHTREQSRALAGGSAAAILSTFVSMGIIQYAFQNAVIPSVVAQSFLFALFATLALKGQRAQRNQHDPSE